MEISSVLLYCGIVAIGQSNFGRAGFKYSKNIRKYTVNLVDIKSVRLKNSNKMGSTISTENETLKIEIGGDEKTTRKRSRKPYNRVKTTKYTWYSFLPLNLFEQFRRLAYFYYLIVTIISFFVNSTISPLTSLIPLLFVILVSGIKQGREEFLRYRTDKVVNNCPVTVIRKGKKCSIAAQYVAPGDLVYIERDCDVPCDLVLLYTTDIHGKCYITTANLDGETNLKTLIVPRGLPKGDPKYLDRLGVIECEQSKTDLYDFNGKILLSGKSDTAVPLSVEHLLLSGAHVKNTEFVIGCAVYTGMTTKLQLNSRLTSNKAASSDGYINRYLIFLVVVMVLFVTILYFFERHDELFVVPLMSYLGPPVEVNRVAEILEDYLSFLVIVNYMVPISMYMNIELYRVFGALFLMWDRKLYDEETDQPCVVNTSNLNEELGQINFLFSDKTGTLTKNEMIFQRCSIDGEKFLYKNGILETVDAETVIDVTKFDHSILTFFEALAICHTVQVMGSSKNEDLETSEADGLPQSVVDNASVPIQLVKTKETESLEYKSEKLDQFEENQENLKDKPPTRSPSVVSLKSYAEPVYQYSTVSNSFYQASSADEKALVEACAQLGLVYLGDENEILRLQWRTDDDAGRRDLEFNRLHVLEFTPERKRMSVIVEDSTGEKWIYSKGAESVIFPLCGKSSSDLVYRTDKHITDFAKLGLRTLAIARRRLSEEEYLEFYEKLNEANNSLSSRKQLSEACYARVEKDLQLLGATAVEDVLQDDVGETLCSLQRAGLQIWVLTGDKVETALNIALACGHIPPQAKRHLILNCTNEDSIIMRLSALDSEVRAGNQCALLIDGESLAIALREIPNEFRNAAINCCAVLCCRLSPLQKSQVIALMKTSTEKYITAAIGDGANDVSMIQEAHVGIGIMGKEGRQAARSADFAIAKFSMLKRLLLVHGHYNTERLSFLVLFYCYKNVVITGNMFLYQFHSLFSATAVYHSLFLWLYDVIYISGGMTCVTLLERPYSEETLLREPELYKENAHNRQVRWSVFLMWMINGLYQTLVVYFLAYYALTTNDMLWNSGETADFYCFGIILVQVVIFVENLKLLLAAKHLSYWLIGIVIASMILFVVSTVIYNVANTSSALYLLYNHLLGSIPMWLFTIVATVACLLPDFTYAATHSLLNISSLKKTSRKAV